MGDMLLDLCLLQCCNIRTLSAKWHAVFSFLGGWGWGVFAHLDYVGGAG